MKALTVIAATGLFAAVLAAQSAAPPGDSMAALLAEVRQLRLVMERSAQMSPRIQILASRLGVQDQRVARMTRDLTDVKDHIAQKVAEAQAHTSRVSELEAGIQAEPDVPRRKAFEEELRAVKQQIDAMSLEEQQLRAREAEAASALAAEQNQWNDLTRRLDELEKSLEIIK